ncbi:MAG: ABC-three component system middle component 2 [Fimbriiglobus sp.]
MTEATQTPSGDRLFNTPLECGMRSVALLFAAYPKSCDVQRLVQYDYLIVHSGDVDGGPESIHPATPHRSGELLVRRSLVEAGLDFMACRRVIEKTYSGMGIEYLAGEYAVVFLDALASEYVRQLRERANWVVRTFQAMPDEELNRFMADRWSRWGAEFVGEALLGETDE